MKPLLNLETITICFCDCSLSSSITSLWSSVYLEYSRAKHFWKSEKFALAIMQKAYRDTMFKPSNHIMVWSWISWPQVQSFYFFKIPFLGEKEHLHNKLIHSKKFHTFVDKRKTNILLTSETTAITEICSVKYWTSMFY